MTQSTSTLTTRGQDAIYPSSMVGMWRCQRTVTSVEGDVAQAELCWRLLGGKSNNGSSLFQKKEAETFDTRFVLPPENTLLQNLYNFDGETYRGVILDRGFELASRTTQTTTKDVHWSMVDMPNTLSYNTLNDNKNTVDITVVQRKVELPSERGFGFDELYRITSKDILNNDVQRAVRVQRRHRRALDERGNRIVEGLEIMKTYRVLDGIAGIEMPTSTTKSILRYTRES